MPDQEAAVHHADRQSSALPGYRRSVAKATRSPLDYPRNWSDARRDERPRRAQDSGRNLALRQITEGRSRPVAPLSKLRLVVVWAGHDTDTAHRSCTGNRRRRCPRRSAARGYSHFVGTILRGSGWPGRSPSFRRCASASLDIETCRGSHSLKGPQCCGRDRGLE